MNNTKMPVDENMSFESAMSRLEKIVSSLEGGNVSLDESLKLYEEGIALVRFCSTALDNAEQKIKVIKGDSNGTLSEEEFE